MNSSEYIPNESEHRKAFQIAPADPDWTNVIVQARREALESEHLTDGAKALFAYLLDLSVQRGSQRWFGAVAISATKLSERLHRSKRAIYGWNKELIACRFIWVTELPMPNAWPLNVYHVTALDPQDEPNQMPTRDGMWGNGARRQKVPPGPGARVGRMHETTRRFSGVENANSSISAENAPASGTERHLPHAKLATASGKTCDGESQNLRLPIAELATGSGTKEHVPNAQNDTPEQHKTTLLYKAKGTRFQSVEGKDRGKDTSPPQKPALKTPKTDPWEAWAKTLADMFPSKLEKLLTSLTKERSALRANKASYALDPAKLKPKNAEWLEFCDREIARLENGGDKDLLKDRLAQRAEVLADPTSYTERSYTQEAADKLAALDRKIALVKERLEGPQV